MVFGRIVACGLILTLATLGCAAPQMDRGAAGHGATVSGTVTYRERVALRADAFVVVQLQDVSRLDAPGIVIGEHRIESPGKVPIRFEIRYDPARIDPQRTYAVAAQIFQGDRLLFIHDAAYRVITRGNPTQVDMILRPAW